jgi:hypothetical protein
MKGIRSAFVTVTFGVVVFGAVQMAEAQRAQGEVTHVTLGPTTTNPQSTEVGTWLTFEKDKTTYIVYCRTDMPLTENSNLLCVAGDINKIELNKKILGKLDP